MDRIWANMQEDRRNKGYEKRAWWDREGKYHFDYGDNHQNCGDNEFNTAKEGTHIVQTDKKRTADDGLAEFGM